MALRVGCSNTTPWTELRLTSPYFPGSSFLSFLKTLMTLPFSQSLGTSSSCHDLSKMIEIGLAVTSASSHRWWEHTIMDLYIPSIHNMILTCWEWVCITPVFPTSLRRIEFLRKSLLENSRKNILTFSMSFVRILTHSTVGPHFPSFSFVADIPAEAQIASLHVPHQF